MSHSWRIVDTRTDRVASLISYPTEESALRAVEGYRRRDARGGRPDLHDLIPHLGVRPTKESDFGEVV